MVEGEEGKGEKEIECKKRGTNASEDRRRGAERRERSGQTQ